MQKILSIIGAAALAILAFYYIVYTPITSYNEMKEKNHLLTKELAASKEETARVYETFDKAIRYHINPIIVDEIYNDTQFFSKSDSEISVNKDGGQKSFVSYRRLQ